MDHEKFREIDLDFWNNTKKLIILALLERSQVGSVTEMGRIIGRSFSCTYRNLADLEDRGVINIDTTSRAYKCHISLAENHKTLKPFTLIEVLTH
jgi:predicted transcriptional regulator